MSAFFTVVVLASVIGYQVGVASTTSAAADAPVVTVTSVSTTSVTRTEIGSVVKIDASTTTTTFTVTATSTQLPATATTTTTTVVTATSTTTKTSTTITPFTKTSTKTITTTIPTTSTIITTSTATKIRTTTTIETRTTTTTVTTPWSGKTVYAVDIVNGQLVDSSGDRFTMIGVNYGDIPESFQSGDYAADAQNIKNAGFNTVKLVKEWGALENSLSPAVYSYNYTELQIMMQQIGNLTQNNINIVIKLHADAKIPAHAQNLKRFLGAQYCAPPGTYESDFSTSFYTTSYLTSGATGHAHLTNLWLKISEMTRGNPRVIGFDILNEPTYCSYTSKYESSIIHDGWHQRIDETTQALRNDGDTRIIFAEEAPSFEYYVRFTPWSDPKIVSSLHWYRAVYRTTSRTGTFAACWSDPQTLQNYWSNIPGPLGTQCTSDPTWIEQAQQKYPKQLFEIGEFGGISGNSPGDINQQWIQNSVALFQTKGMIGWFYWSSAETGTWIQDLTATAILSTSVKNQQSPAD